jgi:hypothetical protein
VEENGMFYRLEGYGYPGGGRYINLDHVKRIMSQVKDGKIFRCFELVNGRTEEEVQTGLHDILQPPGQIIPAQSGWFVLQLYDDIIDDEHETSFGQTPIIAWNIDALGVVTPICLCPDDWQESHAILRSDGKVELLYDTTYDSVADWFKDVKARKQHRNGGEETVAVSTGQETDTRKED